MAVAMPAVVVLIVCKIVAGGGPPDQNADWTKVENNQWAIENSMMVCQRHEIAMTDPSVGEVADNQSGVDPTKETGALPQPFNQARCLASGVQLFNSWDGAHESRPWRAWRFACPTPMINTITKEIIGWVLPDCGHEDTVKCESDSVI